MAGKDLSPLLQSASTCKVDYARAGLLMVTFRRLHDHTMGTAQTSPIGRISTDAGTLLAREDRNRKVRFMRFVDEVISGAVEDEARPLVLIDLTNSARLWPWLTDQQSYPSKIDINERQWVQEDWAGARIVRVRQDLAPDLLIENGLTS